MIVDYLMFEEFKEFANTQTTYRGDLEKTRALCLCKSKRVFVNLGAEQWKFYYGLIGEEDLIEELMKTLVHESLHMGISYVGLENDFNCGEEHICKMLAGQL